MTYNENDNLSGLKAGDTLVLNDGTKHEAVEDNWSSEDCFKCSVRKDEKCTIRNHSIACYYFHFKKVEP
jgi:quercetin dioxygenase-like cupin family protein